MAICTDSGCTTTNFDAIGRGSSYINSECIRANLAKAPEAVSIIAIGFNGTVCSEIDNRVFLYVYPHGAVALNIDCQVCRRKTRSTIGVIAVETTDINTCTSIGRDFTSASKIDTGAIVIDG